MSFNTKDLNFCTFEKTSDSFQQQYWKRCYDCWPNEEKGACLHCISICHDGHTVDSKVRIGNFFCDCGHEKKGCKLMNNFPIHPVHRIPHPCPKFHQPPMLHPPSMYSSKLPYPSGG